MMFRTEIDEIRELLAKAGVAPEIAEQVVDLARDYASSDARDAVRHYCERQ